LWPISRGCNTLGREGKNQEKKEEIITKFRGRPLGRRGKKEFFFIGNLPHLGTTPRY
jgi:hypothetical protein